MNVLLAAYIFFSIKSSPSNCLPATAPRCSRSPTFFAKKSNHDGTEFFGTRTLLENAKEIDESIARGNMVGDYCESMWSNR